MCWAIDVPRLEQPKPGGAIGRGGQLGETISDHSGGLAPSHISVLGKCIRVRLFSIPLDMTVQLSAHPGTRLRDLNLLEDVPDGECPGCGSRGRLAAVLHVRSQTTCVSSCGPQTCLGPLSFQGCGSQHCKTCRQILFAY